MHYKNILITGGAGFVGSTLCMRLKEYYPAVNVIALDNLMRRGSELNLPRLKKYGVTFIHGDIRNKEDLDLGKVDILIECSAEPSVMAGVTSSPDYLLNTNLTGAINCFELARKKDADIIFLSTSRVYPVKKLNAINYSEEKTRFQLVEEQIISGVSAKGINENFPLDGARSLYGTTKLAAELILQEYRENYGLKVVSNRFGLIAGPWQMGKVDQGVFVLWVARHLFNKPLSYIGFDGSGKQVRDVIHSDDVFEVIRLQMEKMRRYDGQTYNIGGGVKNSVSLLELTRYCQEITGKKVKINKVAETRAGDVALYITDNTKITTDSSWQPRKNLTHITSDIYKWIIKNKQMLEPVLE